MTHLELQLVQVAVFGGVVAGEAVAAHILPPWACQAVPAGSLTHLEAVDCYLPSLQAGNVA